MLDGSTFQSFSKEDLCILVSDKEDEQAHRLSYSFEYLGLILELFDVFRTNFEYFSFSINNSKKVKLNVRQDDFLKEHSLTELTQIGKIIHSRITDWTERYKGMSFGQGRTDQTMQTRGVIRLTKSTGHSSSIRR